MEDPKRTVTLRHDPMYPVYTEAERRKQRLVNALILISSLLWACLVGYLGAVFYGL